MRISAIAKWSLGFVAGAVLAGGVISTTPAFAEGYRVARSAHVVGVASWDYLNIRKWPAAHSRKVGRAAPYANVWVERCIVKRSGSDWCKISWMHQRGWVNSRFLNIN